MTNNHNNLYEDTHTHTHTYSDFEAETLIIVMLNICGLLGSSMNRYIQSKPNLPQVYEMIAE